MFSRNISRLQTLLVTWLVYLYDVCYKLYPGIFLFVFFSAHAVRGKNDSKFWTNQCVRMSLSENEKGDYKKRYRRHQLGWAKRDIFLLNNLSNCYNCPTLARRLQGELYHILFFYIFSDINMVETLFWEFGHFGLVKDGCIDQTHPEYINDYVWMSYKGANGRRKPTDLSDRFGIRIFAVEG